MNWKELYALVNENIKNAVSGLYKPAGDVAFAELPTLSQSVLGYTYTVTDAFTTDSRFTDYDTETQTGHSFPADTEVAVIVTGTTENPVYMFNVMGGIMDGYATKSDLNDYVEKEAGKSLSTNDYTDADKALVQDSPITVTATGAEITASTAQGKPNKVTIYGKSEIVDNEIVSAGEGWATVDLGTLSWTYDSEFYTNAISAIKVPELNTKTILCYKYNTVPTSSTTSQLINKDIMLGRNQRIYIKDADYTDATAFKNSLNGVLLCYQLADPTQGNCIAVKTDDGSGIDGTMATFTTGIPLRATLDGTVKDEMHYNGITGEVITRCEIVSDEVVPLATPIITPLTAQEMTALAELRTFAPTTYAQNNAGATMTVETYAGTANGQAVSELEDKVQKQIDDIKLEREHFCYSYKIDMNNSDPFTNCKPHFDQRYGCDNFNFTSAHMDYANDRFDYGSWEGFIRRIARPCMLKYDGTMDYYLDPDDYSKKITGEASDVADLNYNGNVMVELEKLYFKRYTYNGIQYCFIADRKLDNSFKCYAHHDKYGKELDYIYRAAYDGMYDGTRLRSISGVDYHNLNALTAGYIMSNTTRAEEIAFAQANNTAGEQGEGWYILHKSEWDYINDILLLIGMSTDVQTTFGRGRDSGYVSTADTGIVSTGTMDDKGLFWGKNDGSAGVKVLGIENHWANLYKSMAGYINASGTQKIKQTYGTEDGSAVTGFNTDGTGYVVITGATPTKGDSSTSGGGYITAWKYNDYGLIPYECTSSGSSSKYIPDYLYFNNGQTNFALVGGHSYGSLTCGLFVVLYYGAGDRDWNIGAALSYKGKAA